MGDRGLLRVPRLKIIDVLYSIIINKVLKLYIQLFYTIEMLLLKKSTLQKINNVKFVQKCLEDLPLRYFEVIVAVFKIRLKGKNIALEQYSSLKRVNDFIENFVRPK